MRDVESGNGYDPKERRREENTRCAGKRKANNETSESAPVRMETQSAPVKPKGDKQSVRQ